MLTSLRHGSLGNFHDLFFVALAHEKLKLIVNVDHLSNMSSL